MPDPTSIRRTRSATPWQTPHALAQIQVVDGQQSCPTCRVSDEVEHLVSESFVKQWRSLVASLNVSRCATDAIPVQQFAGPSNDGSGGYWNDGCLLLTPGTGCKGEGDSITTSTPSDNCMTNNRFQSMYALWTILSFNLLLSGDFANLNPFVMATWTNDLAVGINQDPLGITGRRIDNSSDIGAETLLSADWDEEHDLGATANVALMSVAECGGEPTDQKWVFSGTNSTLANKATGACVNVPGCKSTIVYDQCTKTGPSCGPFENSNKMWTLTSTGQLQSASRSDEAECAELQHDKTVQLKRCASPATPEQMWKYDKSTQQLTSGNGGKSIVSIPLAFAFQTVSSRCLC